MGMFASTWVLERTKTRMHTQQRAWHLAQKQHSLGLPRILPSAPKEGTQGTPDRREQSIIWNRSTPKPSAQRAREKMTELPGHTAHQAWNPVTSDKGEKDSEANALSHKGSAGPQTANQRWPPTVTKDSRDAPHSGSWVPQLCPGGSIQVLCFSGAGPQNTGALI